MFSHDYMLSNYINYLYCITLIQVYIQSSCLGNIGVLFNAVRVL